MCKKLYVGSSLNLVLFMLHPWEERDAWVKGLVGLTRVVERLSHVRRWFLMCFNGVWTSWLLAFLGGIRRCMKREDISKPWKGMLLMGLCEYMRFLDLNSSHGECPPLLYILILWKNLCASLGMGCIVLCCFEMCCYGYAWYVSLKVCNHLCLVSPSSVDGLLEA